MEEIIVSNSAAEVIVVPRNLALYPGFFRYGESQAILFPLRAGFTQRTRGLLPIFADEAVNVHARNNIAIQEREHPALCWLKRKLPLQQQRALGATLAQVAVQRALNSARQVRSACSEEILPLGTHPVRRSIERYQKSWRRIEIIESGIFGDIFCRRSQEGVWTFREIGDRILKLPFFSRVAAEEVLAFQQSSAVGNRSELMAEAGSQLASQFVHVPSGSFHEGAERELVNLASPIFNPAQIRVCCPGIRDRHLRDQQRVIAEWGKYDVVRSVFFSPNFLAKISNAKNAFEGLGIPRVEGAEYGFAVCQISKSATEVAPFRRVVVQEFRRALILPHSQMPIVRGQGNNPIITDLVNVFRGPKHAGIHVGLGLWIIHLIADVVERRKPKLILDPLTEMSGAIGF